VKDVRSDTKATGIAHVVGNKGGVAVGLAFMDLRLCFINCHLAAHQHKSERRNSDVHDILKAVKVRGVMCFCVCEKKD
jgi:hypothetical protein